MPRDSFTRAGDFFSAKFLSCLKITRYLRSDHGVAHGESEYVAHGDVKTASGGEWVSAGELARDDGLALSGEAPRAYPAPGVISLDGDGYAVHDDDDGAGR